MRGFALLAMGLLACGQPAVSPPVTLERRETTEGLRLVLVAEAGARINARLKPALERGDGTVLLFDSARLSSDSAYFDEPPTLMLPAHSAVRGRLRASVCRADEKVCRIVVLEVS